MGSWLGRGAPRYRMSVAQLVEDYHSQIPLEPSWMAAAAALAKRCAAGIG